MERMVEYYDYRETVSEMLFRNLGKVLTVVTVGFVFTVMMIAVNGNMEIENLERSLKMEQITQRIQRAICSEKPIMVQKPKLVVEAIEKETEIFEETEEVAEIEDIQEEVTENNEVVEVEETAKASITILSAEEITEAKSINYNPSAEGKERLCKVVFAEAGIESFMGQVLVANVAYNNMIAHGYTDLTQELKEGRYSCIVNGVVYNEGKPVEIEDIPQSVKDAVEEALRNDSTEAVLKAEAERLGITDSKYWEGGAIYFCAPGCEGRENVEVKFQLGGHMFYRDWKK